MHFEFPSTPPGLYFGLKVMTAKGLRSGVLRKSMILKGRTLVKSLESVVAEIAKLAELAEFGALSAVL